MPLLTLTVAIAGLYLYHLDGVGVLGPDEPRYAAIGLSMAHTRDFVTPKLWGAPWYEKPPLLYWITAAASSAGLNPDLSARLPVALLSLLFLTLFYALMRAEFGPTPAALSTFTLATSASWLAYSNLCLTDLPLAASFTLTLLLALPLLRSTPQTSHAGQRFLLIGAFIGLGALAKGLVPFVLCLPFFWFLRHFWRHWWLAAVSCLVVAAPWYAAVYQQNGDPFIQEFFIKHHLERLYSASLQHVQPPYYYLPVLLAALFPWTPLFWLLRRVAWDDRRRFLLAVFLSGFLFFTLSRNKLPGYLLPLIPALFILLGAQFEGKRLVDLSRGYLFGCALLMALTPLLASILPESLSLGKISFTAMGTLSRIEIFYILLPLAVILLARKQWTLPLLVICLVAEGIYLKSVTYPALDQQVSARSMWRKIQTLPGRICDGGTNRNWLYGLTFYQGAPYPSCEGGKFDYALRSHFKNNAMLEPLH